MPLVALGWLAAVPDPVVTGPPPPPPPGAPLGIAIPIVALTLLAITWWIAKRLTRPGSLRMARIGVFGAAIGNALMDLGAILQPDRPSAVEIQRARQATQRPATPGDRGPRPRPHQVHRITTRARRRCAWPIGERGRPRPPGPRARAHP